MSAQFVNVDRETPMLLPPDLRDWVSSDDMVHFVLEAVNGLPESIFKVNRRGTGSLQYPPHMLAALLIYCYSQGIFSSRRIERATWNHIGVRYLTGNTHPDHDTICKFRRENGEAMKHTFLEVLGIAGEMGVLKIGKVSIDGTHIKANASKHKSVRYDRAAELEEQLSNDIEELLKKAEEADSQESEDINRLPEEISRRDKLREKMKEARRRLEERAKEKEELKDRENGEDNEQPKSGVDTVKKIKPRDEEQINLVDPDSCLMRKSRRDGWVQAYNAQAVVDADGSQLVLGSFVSRSPSDAKNLELGYKEVLSNGITVKSMIADAGYASAEAFERLEKTDADFYVAVTAKDHGERRYDFRPVKEKKSKINIRDPRLLKMQEKVRSEEGRRIYRKRKSTVEPVFGIIKHAMGFRQFMLRGMEKVTLEWTLVCTAYNLKRLWALKPG